MCAQTTNGRGSGQSHIPQPVSCCSHTETHLGHVVRNAIISLRNNINGAIIYERLKENSRNNRSMVSGAWMDVGRQLSRSFI